MITKLKISNFKNIGRAEHYLKQINIFEGRNGKGKTNTLHALYWLFTNELLPDNSSNLDNTSIINNIDKNAIARVEVEFDNGLVLAKEYYNVFTETRGTGELVYKGRTTDCYENDAKVSITDFNKKINDLFNLNLDSTIGSFNIASAMTNPLYLNEIDYKILRLFIIAVIGDVTDEEVYAVNPKLETIKSTLDKYSGDYVKARTGAKKVIEDTKKKITDYKAQIKVLTSDLDEARLNELLKEKESLQEKLNTYTPNDGAIELNNEYISLQEKLSKETTKLSELESAYRDSTSSDGASRMAKIEKLRARISEVKLRIESLSHTYKTSESYLDSKKLKFKEIQIDAKKVQEEIKDWSAKVYEPIEDVSCPDCGCVLTAEQNERAKIDFLMNKEQTLEDLQTRLKDYGTNLLELKQKIDTARLEFENLSMERINSEKELENLNEDLELVRSSQVVASSETTVLKNQIETQTEVISSLKDDIGKVKLKITASKELSSNDELVFKNGIKNTITLIDQDLNKLLVIKSNNQKANELKVELQKSQTILTDNETIHILIDTFIKDKIKLLNDRVFDKLGVNFVMLEAQVNGGLKEVCYMIKDNTPYSSLNTSQKLIEGIKLIEGVKSVTGFKDMPIILDKFESVNNDRLSTELVTNSQLIIAKVTGNYHLTLNSFNDKSEV